MNRTRIKTKGDVHIQTRIKTNIFTLKTDQHNTCGHHLTVFFSVVQYDGDNTVVSGSYDKTIRVWDLRRGACMRILEEHSAAVFR